MTGLIPNTLQFVDGAEQTTTDSFQGVFGEFSFTVDAVESTPTADTFQGVFGEFKPVVDATA